MLRLRLWERFAFNVFITAKNLHHKGLAIFVRMSSSGLETGLCLHAHLALFYVLDFWGLSLYFMPYQLLHALLVISMSKNESNKIGGKLEKLSKGSLSTSFRLYLILPPYNILLISVCQTWDHWSQNFQNWDQNEVLGPRNLARIQIFCEENKENSLIL